MPRPLQSVTPGGMCARTLSTPAVSVWTTRKLVALGRIRATELLRAYGGT